MERTYTATVRITITGEQDGSKKPKIKRDDLLDTLEDCVMLAIDEDEQNIGKTGLTVSFVEIDWNTLKEEKK